MSQVGDIFREIRKHEQNLNNIVHLLNADTAKETDSAGELPLHKVVRFGPKGHDFMKALIGFHPDGIKQIDSHGKLPIHAYLMVDNSWEDSSESECTRYLQSLIDAFPDSLSKQDWNGNLPLHSALLARNVMLPGYCHCDEILKSLISVYPQSLKVMNKNGNLPLHLAARKRWSGDGRVIEFLIQKYPEAVKVANEEGNLPIHLAVWQKDVSMIKNLIEKFPAAATMSNKNGMVPCNLTDTPDIINIIGKACPSSMQAAHYGHVRDNIMRSIKEGRIAKKRVGPIQQLLECYSPVHLYTAQMKELEEREKGMVTKIKMLEDRHSIDSSTIVALKLLDLKNEKENHRCTRNRELELTERLTLQRSSSDLDKKKEELERKFAEEGQKLKNSFNLQKNNDSTAITNMKCELGREREAYQRIMAQNLELEEGLRRNHVTSSRANTASIKMKRRINELEDQQKKDAATIKKQTSMKHLGSARIASLEITLANKENQYELMKARKIELLERLNSTQQQPNQITIATQTDITSLLEARKSELRFLSKIQEMKECLNSKDLTSILQSLSARLNNMKNKLQPGHKASYPQKYAKKIISLSEKGEEIEWDDGIDTILDINKELLELERTGEASVAADNTGANAVAQNIKIESDVISEHPVNVSRKRARVSISPS